MTPTSLHKKSFLILILILAITFLIFFPSLGNSFVNWDDHAFIHENPLVYDRPFTNFSKIWSQDLDGRYYPLTILTFQIEHYFFGLEPFFYHLINLVLHLMNVVIVFFLISRLRFSMSVVGLATLLFAVHPLQVEAVAWVSSLKDLLATTFFILAFGYYCRVLESGPQLRLTQQLVLCVLTFLSLSAKPIAVTLPIVLLFYDFWHRRKLGRQEIFSKIPVTILVIFFAIVHFRFFHLAQAFPAGRESSWIDGLWLSGQALGLYAGKLIFPIQLSNIYPLPEKIQGFFPAEVYVSAVLTFYLIFLIFKEYRRDPRALLGFVFFLIVLLPSLHFVKINNGLIFERFVYLPSVGLFLFFANEFFRSRNKVNLSLRKLFGVLLFIYLAVLMSFSWQRCFVWKNPFTLWTDAILNSPNSPNGYLNRASFSLEQREFSQAFMDIETAIQLNPRLGEAYVERAKLWVEKKNLKEAILDYSKAINFGLTFQKDLAKVYNNRGNLYSEMSQDDLAIADYNKALDLHSGDIFALLNRAIVFMKKKMWTQALSDFETVLKQDPRNLYAQKAAEMVKLKIMKQIP